MAFFQALALLLPPMVLAVVLLLFLGPCFSVGLLSGLKLFALGKEAFFEAGFFLHSLLAGFFWISDLLSSPGLLSTNSWAASCAALSSCSLQLTLIFSRIVMFLEKQSFTSSSSSFAAFGELRMAGQPWESTETSETCSFKVLAFLQACSSGSFKEAELELPWPPASAAFAEEVSLAALAFLQAWSSSGPGAAFLQASGKSTISRMDCLSAPVAPCRHCLSFEESLFSLLTWLSKQTNWLASLPAHRSSFHSLSLWVYPYLRMHCFKLPRGIFSFWDFVELLDILCIVVQTCRAHSCAYTFLLIVTKFKSISTLGGHSCLKKFFAKHPSPWWHQWPACSTLGCHGFLSSPSKLKILRFKSLEDDWSFKPTTHQLKPQNFEEWPSFRPRPGNEFKPAISKNSSGTYEYEIEACALWMPLMAPYMLEKWIWQL